MTPDSPKYRPLERFWPYAELPEQPTDDELAAIDPDLQEALFGNRPRPFSITLVFPRLDLADFDRALELARASAEFRETGSGAAHRYRARFWSSDAVAAARSVSDRRDLRRHRRADRRSPGAVRARTVAAARLVPAAPVAVVPASETERDLNRLEADLKRLEAEYNMFFAGRLPKPPWETRSRVEALIKRSIAVTSRTPAIASASRRCSRALPRSSISGIAACARARKGVRVRSYLKADKPGPEEPPEDRIVHVAAFHDPMAEMDKLHDLYDSLVEARGASRRRGGAVPQVRRAREDAGRQAEGDRQRRSRVSRGGEGRKGELHGARAEGADG